MSISHESNLDQVSLLDRLEVIQDVYKAKRGTAVQQETSTEVKPVMRELRHRQGDLFIADLYSISNSFFGDMASLEFPIFALKSSKEAKTFTRARDGLRLEIIPSVNSSTPTIYDADIWVYAISKLLKAADKGEKLNRTIRFTAYDFLITTERNTDKREYDRLLASLERLQGTKLKTTHEWHENIRSPKLEPCKHETIRAFNFIDEYKVGKTKINRRNKVTGKIEEVDIMGHIEITLPNWLFEAVEQRAVLKLSPDYFRIDKPLHRRLYELARKHCGNQPAVTIALELLREKAGSTSALKLFKHQIKQVQAAGDLPDYQYTLNEATNIVTISRKKTTGST